MKILILGGYGTFGGRLVELLADESSLTLVVAGRSLARARAFVQSHAGAARAALVAIELDREAGLDEALRSLAPDLVVDASGPFQAYGANAYAVVEACVRHRVHYLDLADATDFVAGISALDGPARLQGVFAISGASTLPALSFAVVRHLSHGDGEEIVPLDIAAGIAPSPTARVGANVVRAILGYAGKPVSLLRAGRAAQGTALVDSVRCTIAPPGGIPLRPRRFSVVDVPDLALAAASWPQLRSVWVGAAPAPAARHGVLTACARLVRMRLLPNLAPLSRLGHWACVRARWGEARGGMFVRVIGRGREGAGIERTWHLAAEGDDGPYIPSMAAAAIVRRCLQGRVPHPGARACIADLELADFEPFFRERRIRHGVREHRAGDPRPLYARVLGDAWERLPAAIRTLHGEGGAHEVRGEARVERGRGLAALAARIARFPPPSDRVPLHVIFDSRPGGERWERRFGTHPMTSFQWQGRGAADGLLGERMGAARIDMALVENGGRLEFVMRGWRLLGIPMPRFLGPTLTSREEETIDGVRFLVEIGHPLTGMVVRYAGTHAVPRPAARREPAQSSVM